jgi:hypothetical protein
MYVKLFREPGFAYGIRVQVEFFHLYHVAVPDWGQGFVKFFLYILQCPPFYCVLCVYHLCLALGVTNTLNGA